MVAEKKSTETRAWPDNPLPWRSKECEESRTNSPGSLLHGRPGGRQRVSGVATAEVHPFGSGGV